jgi:Flp pilus assembly protein TadG
MTDSRSASPKPRAASREPRRSLWACERGAELVEFAFVFPTLMLVMLGIIDFGFLFQHYEVVTNAAREGARVAILPGYADADVQARVTQYLTAGGLTGTATVTVGAPQAISVGSQCISVRPVTVSYQHQFLFLGPILGLMGIVGGGGTLADRTLNATSSMRSEIAAGACP